MKTQKRHILGYILIRLIAVTSILVAVVIIRLKNAGVNAIKLVVDLNTRVSFPTINIFMMLLGISLALRSGMGGGLFTAGLGLVMSLTYWFSYTFSLSISYAGIVPAGIAAWSVPVIFGSLEVYLFTTTPE